MGGSLKSLSERRPDRIPPKPRLPLGRVRRQHDFATFEPTFPASLDQRFSCWQEKLRTLTSSQVSIRAAAPTPEDARRMWDIQLACEPITVLSLEENTQTIHDRLTFFAEIDGVHVGLCIAVPEAKASDPLFVQVVAVVPTAQRRGIGRKLLAAAASEDAERDIVFATQENNQAARAMNARFASELGATIERVNMGVYPDRYLGIQRGQGYRVWKVKRPR